MKLKIVCKEWLLLCIVLSFAVVTSVSIWYVRNYYRLENRVRVVSEDGSFDLGDIAFEKEFVYLQGKTEYIPNILTPEAFADHEDEIQYGNPWQYPFATSRIRIFVPDDRTYTITASSIDFAHRVYVNGELRFEAGNPAENEAEFVAGRAQMTLDVKAENGVIEIIQQAANYVHREGGGHMNICFGSPKIIQTYLALTYGPETMIIGLFFVLFLVHLVLYIMRQSYKPNLIFSLLCLTWMVRSGVTQTKVFFSMFPNLSWYAAFRAEYLSLPLAAILIVLLIREVFPFIMQKWFVRTLLTVSSLFGVLCLVMDTLPLSSTLIYYELFFTLTIFYLCIRFAMKVPKQIQSGQFQIEQTISLIGLSIFMFATINDAMYHSSIFYMLGISSFAMTGLAMMIFSFFQMTAMFYGTMRETALAHEREQRASAENEMLTEMNRLKSAFYTDMSHEMKTPLTIIAVNAQFAAQNIESGEIDEEMVTDLNAISTEARRLAQMVTSLVGIGRMQDSNEGLLDLKSLLVETVRIYQSLFARKGNKLTVEEIPELPPVAGIADQLIQVLINLLSNANRHTEGGNVFIKAEVLSDKVKISVIDNGSGIAMDMLPHVFERFCHGEKGGSGLGLYICKTIIEDHGGEMGIESEEGIGTTVWFTLPIKEGE